MERLELLYDISRKLSSSLDLDKVLSDILVLTIPSVGATRGSIIVLDESGRARRQILIREELATPVAEQVVTQILDKGLAGWVVRHKKGAIVFDTRDDERWLPLTDDHLATRSAIAVPLLRQERVVGVLILVHPEPNKFSEEHLDLLSSIANQAAIAVENARLYDDSQRRLHELSVLYEVSQAASSLRLDETLRLIAEKTARALRADRCALFLLDEERGDLVLRAVDNPDRPAETLGLRLPLEARPQVAEAIATRKPVEIPDIFADPSKEDFWPLARKLNIRACLAVPIMVKEKVIGAISLDRVGDQPPFSTDEVSLCQTIANQAAVAIENARLYEKVTERMREATALYKVSNQLMRTLNLDQVLEKVLGVLQRSFGYLNCAILLVDEEAGELEVKAARGYLQETARKVRLKIGQGGIVGRVAAHKTPLNVPDVTQDSRYVKGVEETRSEIAVPMIAGDKTIGVLDVQSPEVNAFNDDDLRVLSSVAAQAAIAIERARLYSAERRRAQESSTLLAIAQALSSTLDLTQVLKLVARSTAQACHANRCSILLLNQDRKELVPIMSQFASGEVDRELWATFKERYAEAVKEFPILQEVIRERKPVVLDGPAMSVVPKRWIEPFGIVSLLMVPLISKDEVIGLMALDHVEEGRRFTDEQVNLAITIGTHAAMAIENARLHTTIAEERAKLEAIIGGTNDAVIVTDTQNRVLLMNQAARRAFDVETVPEAGSPLEEVVSNEKLLALFARPEVREEALAEEIPLSDGRTLYASLTPVAEVGCIAVMQDITYLKELDKMKSDFVATVSHDLRSPLANISGYALLLPEAGELNETQQEFVEGIRLSVARMTTLINNLLDLGKIEARVGMEMKPCQLVAVINEVVKSLKEQARAKEIVLQLDLPPELPLVLGNRVRLDQVVSNLVSNAIKFTPEGGVVTVSAIEEKGEVVVEVKDTGIGIAPKDQVHLFEKFYRVRSEETSGIEGTGLGLAIVKSIVEGHGGRVWVKSQPGQGSTFGFALPLP
ncbi:MAG TPA: GAF domain-containing protein [Anaerolineae bacterium]|nr:GAF domain-containing protein [Anaerolineae bacterium]